MGLYGLGVVPWVGGVCLSYIVRRHLLLGLIVDEFDLNVTSVAIFRASGSSLPFFNTSLHSFKSMFIGFYIVYRSNVRHDLYIYIYIYIILDIKHT